MLPPAAVIPLIVPENALGSAVPPWALTTCLTMINCAAISSLVMVQVAVCARASVIVFPFWEPPVQVHALAW